MAQLIEQHTAQAERAVAAALDPRKLSAAAGGPLGGGPGGARSSTSPAPGSSAKWQVRNAAR